MSPYLMQNFTELDRSIGGFQGQGDLTVAVVQNINTELDQASKDLMGH